MKLQTSGVLGTSYAIAKLAPKRAGVHGAGSVFKAGDNIAGKTIVQVRQGTNGKIAVIGRRMPGHVDDVASELASQGKQVEAFNDLHQSGKKF